MFPSRKTLTDKERKDKIAQLASLNKEFTSIEGFDDAIRTVTQITAASTLQTLMSVDEPKDSAFFMVKSKDESGKEVNGYLLDVVLTFDNNDKLAMYDYFYVPEKQAEEPKVGSIRDVLAPVIKSKVETRTAIKDGEAVQYEVVVDYVTYENKRERVTAEDKNRTEEEQKAFDEAESAKFYADKAILENEVAKNNLQYEKEAREAALKGENLLKDSKGNILTKKVTSEAALKEEASFKERISKLETNIVNTTIPAQASLQMSLEKASKVEEIAKAKFETAKDADKTAADKEYQDLKAKTEKERTMLEKLTGDFMNLGGNSEQYKDVDKGLVNKDITYLSNVIKNGGSVVNCATDALSNVGEGEVVSTAMQAVVLI